MSCHWAVGPKALLAMGCTAVMEHFCFLSGCVERRHTISGFSHFAIQTIFFFFSWSLKYSPETFQLHEIVTFRIKNLHGIFQQDW